MKEDSDSIDHSPEEASVQDTEGEVVVEKSESGDTVDREDRIVKRGMLHNVNGKLNVRGWATEPLLRYDRSRIKASKLRIKEWDYYLINDDEYAVALTLGDLGFAGLLSASVINLVHPASKTVSAMVPLPRGRIDLPANSTTGISRFKNARVDYSFRVEEGQRRIVVRFNDFQGSEPLVVDALLDCEPQDSMVIVTPWAEDDKAFYYNRKILAMRASGSFKVGRRVHGFSPTRSFGLLDWGRGVWTYDNTWFWAFAQGWQDGKGGTESGTCKVGLNLGYGFGDESAASENMLFLDGHVEKLGRVDFGIPRTAEYATATKNADRYRLMEEWHITDDQGKLDLRFTPRYDRIDYIDFKAIVSDQHQVFGEVNGTIETEEGSFQLAHLMMAAEVIHNRY